MNRTRLYVIEGKSSAPRLCDSCASGVVMRSAAAGRQCSVSSSTAGCRSTLPVATATRNATAVRGARLRSVNQPGSLKNINPIRRSSRTMKDTRNIQSARELVEFVRTQTASRGWGRSLRTAVSEWYMRQPLAKLALEVLPDLAAHRHIVRRAHPKPRTLAHNAFFQWVTTGELGHLATPEIRAAQFGVVDEVERLQKTPDLHEAVRLIEEYRLAPELVLMQLPQSGPNSAKSASDWRPLRPQRSSV
jgi:hypothetical protein